MSANNVIVLKTHKDKIYGFHIMAEKGGILDVELVTEKESVFIVDTVEEAEDKAQSMCEEGWIEYGWAWDYLPKDGIEIKIVSDKVYKQVWKLQDKIMDILYNDK